MIHLQINNVNVALNQVIFSDGAKSLSVRSTIPANPVSAVITATPTNTLPEMLFDIAQCVNVIRQINSRINIKLVMPYVPYARQDRPMVRNDAFSLRVFAALLNSLNLDKVVVLDAHSDVSCALINNSFQVHQHQILSTSSISRHIPSNVTLVAPDAGSLKKIDKVAEARTPSGLVVMAKNRDPATGQISGSRIVDCDLPSLRGRDCLIVDDICDGGATFINIAKTLKSSGVNKIYLWVTHGIFSKGLQPLFDAGIDTVYTTNSLDQSAQLAEDWGNKFCIFDVDYIVNSLGV